MKPPRTSAGLTLAASFLLCLESSGFTAVKDNFNGSELDAKRWKLVNSGDTKFRQSDGSLQFTVGPKGATLASTAYVELRHNQPGYNEDWLVRILAFNATRDGRNTSVGFTIYNADDPSDSFRFELFSKRVFPKQRVTARAHFEHNGTTVTADFENLVKGRHHADLIVTFNHKTRLFTFYSGVNQEDDAGDWKWTEIGTFSPTGKGGDARADWQLNPGSGRFGIRLTGSCKDEIVEDGDAFIGYFALKQTLDLP